jgi:hypothetical protein
MPNIPFIIYIVIISVIRIIFRSLYGSRRYRKYSFSRFRELLQDLHARYGGSMNGWTNWSEYVMPDGLRIRATYRGRAVQRIFLPHQFDFSSHLFRVPQFLFSLIGPILPESTRIGELPYIVNGNTDQLNSTAIIEILERLNRFGYTIHIGSRGITLTKTLTPDDAMEIPFMETLRTIREFAKLLDGPVIDIPVSELNSDSKCAYCKEEMLPTNEITHCLQCGTPHHTECFDLNGQCSVFGCTSNQREPVTHTERLLQ